MQENKKNFVITDLDSPNKVRSNSFNDLSLKLQKTTQEPLIIRKCVDSARQTSFFPRNNNIENYEELFFQRRRSCTCRDCGKISKKDKKILSVKAPYEVILDDEDFDMEKFLSLDKKTIRNLKKHLIPEIYQQKLKSRAKCLLMDTIRKVKFDVQKSAVGSTMIPENSPHRNSDKNFLVAPTTPVTIQRNNKNNSIFLKNNKRERPKSSFCETSSEK